MRVSDTIRKSTLFIGIRDQVGEITYGGTAFLVTIPGERKGSFSYLVTAKHVLDQIKKQSADGSFAVRANLVNGESVLFDADIGHWFYHDDKDIDVAVSIFSPPIEIHKTLDARFIPISNFLTEDNIKTFGIGSGDEVFMTGLFVNAAGTFQNMPIVRMGSIALMPSEKISHGGKLIDAYLVESRSIGGLSGSPAFVSATIRVAYPSKPQQFYWVPGQSFFLGLVRGHWDILPNRALLEAEKVNMGISVVVPAAKIKELLYTQEQIELRKRVEERIIREDKSGTLDADFSKQFTKQDFQAALKKVSRKTKPKK
jgi:hypothetical protein